MRASSSDQTPPHPPENDRARSRSRDDPQQQNAETRAHSEPTRPRPSENNAYRMGMAVGRVYPEVEVSVLMPAYIQGFDSDESFYPVVAQPQQDPHRSAAVSCFYAGRAHAANFPTASRLQWFRWGVCVGQDWLDGRVPLLEDLPRTRPNGNPYTLPHACLSDPDDSGLYSPDRPV